jgi:hypothetical protein
LIPFEFSHSAIRFQHRASEVEIESLPQRIYYDKGLKEREFTGARATVSRKPSSGYCLDFNQPSALQNKLPAVLSDADLDLP